MRASHGVLIGLGMIVSALVAMAACGGDSRTAPEGAVRLNELQVIASHNSYHLEPPRAILDTITAIVASDPQKWSEYKTFVQSAEYSQPPLAEQFDRGVLNIEIDVYADSKGGLFAKRVGAAALGLAATEGLEQLQAPGFKVMHAPEVDFMSTCWTLQSCLRQISGWSAAHPGHLPLIISIEAKDDVVPDPLNLGFAIAEKVGRAELDALDAEIQSVFSRSSIVTPDDVRGKRQTLEQAVLKDGWPTVESARGKVLFLLIDHGAKRDAYTQGRESLQGRMMFTESDPGSPAAAVVYVGDPTDQVGRIGDLVRRGYIVRTMADADTLEARAGNTARRDAALASGAHLIATDFLEARPALGGSYRVAFEGGLFVRCNALTAKKACARLLGGGVE